jgi:F-box-like
MELLMLPEELLSSIVASIDDVATLRQVATVCKRLNDLAEPFLYQSLIVSDGSQAVLLAEAIADRPSRALHVRSLLASTRFEKAKGIEQLPGSLAVMRNLQDLSLETPDCNKKGPDERIPWIRLQERYERIFQHSSLLLQPQARSLPRLRSCMSILPTLRTRRAAVLTILWVCY